MLGRKMYKTKLCLLYQRGRCPRQNCSFAHGEVELRRFGGSLNGRRDYRSSDLRDRLDRRQSPIRRYSPGRDGRAHHNFRSHKAVSHDRASSLSRSPIRRSERRPKKKRSMDGESDISESHKLSDGFEDTRKENNVSSFDGKVKYEEQLRQAKSDIEKLEDHKSQLAVFLEKKFEEEQRLSSKIKDLEMQLNREQEDCKRINSKIEKFFKAYGRYIKAQEELKRSQARFQKFGDQLGLDISKLGANEDDSSINIISDGERNGDLIHSGYSLKKRPLLQPAAVEEVKLGNVSKKIKLSATLSKPTWSEDAPKDAETVKLNQEEKDLPLSLLDGYKRKRGKFSPKFGSLSKNRSSETERVLPYTSLVANAIDELIEDIGIVEKSRGMEAVAAPSENGTIDDKIVSSYIPPLPPPVNQNVYKQYEGDEEEDIDIDVEKVDSEMVDIDLNGEVDIEQ
ncbi:zinc finger CCCH domain-containing protein 13 [Phalaenopsis equestris]|uniref:zinc finger CCCH domain-containing protein 13 n=1 Tax=Phalaenopsis equestris TaxID=78828 RepID=UPI0009E4D071|nr:zinc finger CCCH domain-containing protein 13 [Phalaenopsis equestris]